MAEEIDLVALAGFVCQQVRGALPQLIAVAVTTGDAATTDTIGSITTSQVTVWLDGATQTPENKVSVTLPYGQATPAAGQLWLVLLVNFNRQDGALLVRTG